MNACIVFQADITWVQCYLTVDNTLMCYENIWSKSNLFICNIFMHTSFYILLHFVLLYYYIIEQRFWGAYIVLASAIVQSSLNKYVYTKSKMKNRCPWCPGLPYLVEAVNSPPPVRLRSAEPVNRPPQLGGLQIWYTRAYQSCIDVSKS